MPTLAFFTHEASYATAQSSYVNQIETVIALLVIAGVLLAAAVFKKYLDRAVIVTDLGTIVRLSLKMVLLAAIAIVSFWIVLTH
jgi:hypothetical protein